MKEAGSLLWQQCQKRVRNKSDIRSQVHLSENHLIYQILHKEFQEETPFLEEMCRNNEEFDLQILLL